MSHRSVGASPKVEGPVATVLTWLQHVGDAPVVNPTKHPWTAPAGTTRPLGLAGWFLYGLIALFVLAGFSVWFGGAFSAFIYAGF